MPRFNLKLPNKQPKQWLLRPAKLSAGGAGGVYAAPSPFSPPDTPLQVAAAVVAEEVVP